MTDEYAKPEWLGLREELGPPVDFKTEIGVAFPTLCPSEFRGEKMIADSRASTGGPAIRFGLTLLCEIGCNEDHRHRGPHQSTLPDGTIWQWPNTSELPGPEATTGEEHP